MSIVCCVFKCVNLGKINKKSGTLSVFLSLNVQRFCVPSATLFCCRRPGCQDASNHYQLNRPFWLKRVPKGKETGGNLYCRRYTKRGDCEGCDSRWGALKEDSLVFQPIFDFQRRVKTQINTDEERMAEKQKSMVEKKVFGAQSTQQQVRQMGQFPGLWI